MTLRDVLEYRAADTTRIVFSEDDLPGEAWAGTVYSRPFGASQWGYHSGEFYFDRAYKASHHALNSESS